MIDRVLKNILNELKIEGSDKSSHWQSLTKNFTFSEDFQSLGIDGFGTFTKWDQTKQYLHIIFQKILFWKHRFIFGTRTFDAIYKICKKQRRILDLDALRHVYTFDFLFRNLKLRKSTVCCIGDGMCNFVAPATMFSSYNFRKSSRNFTFRLFDYEKGWY